MSEKDQIKELFRDAFEHFEQPVNPELWTKISGSITQAPVVNTAAASGQAATGSNLVGSIGSWIAGVAIVATTAFTVYYFSTHSGSSQQQSPSETTLAEPVDVSGNPAPVGTESNKESDAGMTEYANSTQASAAGQTASTGTPITNPGTDNTSGLPVSNNSAFADDKFKPALTETDKMITTGTITPASPAPGLTTQPAPGNTDLSELRIKADPVSGTAPLTVHFSIDGLQQQPEKAEWLFGDGYSTSDQIQTSFTYNQPGNYLVRLKYTDKSGKMYHKSVPVRVTRDLHIANVPNILTPNNDGFNDVFTFDTSELSDYEVHIFDQSGRIVHKWASPVSYWDGRINSGHDAKEGTYFYIIFATGNSGEKHQQKGTLTLKR